MSEPPADPLAWVTAAVRALWDQAESHHAEGEKTLTRVREELVGGYRKLTQEVQAAFQRLRDEQTGEKRANLALLAELIERARDLDRLAKSVPAAVAAVPEVARWAEAVAVAARASDAGLARLGVFRYDAAVGDVYRPELHERVGGRSVAGVEAGRVAEQLEAGYASRSPDFVPVRAKVLISE